jgi:hypothetical protein
VKRAIWIWGLLALLFLSVGLNLGLLLGRWRTAPGAVVVGPEGPPFGAPERPGEGPPPQGPRDRAILEGAERIAGRLGLEDADRERFVAIQREFVDGMLDARWQQGRVRGELRRELTAPRPDPERIENLVGESAELGARIDRLLADHVLRSREILDGEAEDRYLRFLARLGSGPPGPRPDLRRRP